LAGLKTLIMFRRYFFFSALLVATNANAQISITSADMPVANEVYPISTTIDQWSIDVTQTGSNHIWDFSFLTRVSQLLDTTFEVQDTPTAYQFFFNNNFVYPAHVAQFARRGQDLDLFGFLTITNVFDFFSTSNNKYKNVGYGARINGFPNSVRNQPVDTIYKFPLTDGTPVYGSYSVSLVNIPTILYYRQQKTMSNATVDGWGSITTPLGTFDCIRVKMTIDIRDSLSMDVGGFPLNFGVNRPTETQYHWLANGKHVPVLQINTSFGVITTIRYLDTIANLSVEENRVLPIVAYPNPVSDILLVEHSREGGWIELYDMNGKKIHTQNFTSGTDVSYVNVHTYPAGNYIVRMQSGKEFRTGKITVTH